MNLLKKINWKVLGSFVTINLMIPVAFISISAFIVLVPLVLIIFIGFRIFKGNPLIKIIKIVSALIFLALITYCLSHSWYGHIIGW